jgi:DNA-3-methyladenine glycosylase I
MLILEGKQAGLAWITILRKMDSLCQAFDNFDPEIIVTYSEDKINALLQNPGIIRNRLKVQAVLTNAQAYLDLLDKVGSLDRFLWDYVNNRPIINNWTDLTQIPATSPLSDQISRDLKKLGFKFVGSTIIYSFLQAVGLVNDHLKNCHFKKVPQKPSKKTPKKKG